eukprot:1825492-Lingulodinium_polyedra.AAC.1
MAAVLARAEGVHDSAPQAVYDLAHRMLEGSFPEEDHMQESAAKSAEEAGEAQSSQFDEERAIQVAIKEAGIAAAGGQIE